MHINPLESDMQTQILNTARPVLSEGASYKLEIMSTGKLHCATLLRFVDDVPGLRGFSFQIGKRRQFVRESDLTCANGYLIAAV